MTHEIARKTAIHMTMWECTRSVALELFVLLVVIDCVTSPMMSDSLVVIDCVTSPMMSDSLVVIDCVTSPMMSYSLVIGCVTSPIMCDSLVGTR